LAKKEHRRDKMEFKTLISTGLALSLVFGGISPLAKPTEPNKAEAAGFTFTKAQTDALNHVNAIRAKMGLDPVKLDPFLNKSAENHANYLALNNITGHGEIPGKKGYTGKTPQDRAKAVGSTLPFATEGISYQKKTIIEGINSFMASAYHRAPFVGSELTHIGVGIASNGTVVVTFGSTGSFDKDAFYPYDGQTNVDIEFYGKTENPNPLKQFKVEKSGFILSYTEYEDADTKNLKLLLKDSKGVEVPVFIEKQRKVWFFFPKKELKYNETYTANIKYDYDYTDYYDKDWLIETSPGVFDWKVEHITVDKTWSFTTMKAPTGTVQPTKPTTPKVDYYDASVGEYWSDAMIWAVDKKYISAYMNVPKPYNPGSKVNLLKPDNAMTEAEFLIALTKYFYPDEYAKTKPTDKKFMASVAYQLAAKYKLPTKASLKNKANATKPISRSTTAILFASAYNKKPINESNAFKFMQSTKQTSVKSLKDYKPKDNLTRANAAIFLKKYDEWQKTQKRK
jgi:uncharacterized protein YkwD